MRCRAYLGWALLGFVVSALSSCTPSVPGACQRWRAEGDFFISERACAECLRRFGEANKEAVNACGIGIDAAQLFGGSL